MKGWFFVLLAVIFGTVATGFSGSKPDTLWIARSDGSLSCGSETARTLDEDAAELRKAGVTVLESRKANDGKMHIQVCGAATGALNSFNIVAVDWPKAEKLKYRVVPGPKTK